MAMSGGIAPSETSLGIWSGLSAIIMIAEADYMTFTKSRYGGTNV